MAREATGTKTRTEIKYPDRFNVIIHNDDFTPMEFVIRLLIEVFNRNIEDAGKLTLVVHEDGRAIVGSYGLEIAEQKREESTLIARQHGYPLKITIEKM